MPKDDTSTPNLALAQSMTPAVATSIPVGGQQTAVTPAVTTAPAATSPVTPKPVATTPPPAATTPTSAATTNASSTFQSSYPVGSQAYNFQKLSDPASILPPDKLAQYNSLMAQDAAWHQSHPDHSGSKAGPAVSPYAAEAQALLQPYLPKNYQEIVDAIGNNQLGIDANGNFYSKQDNGGFLGELIPMLAMAGAAAAFGPEVLGALGVGGDVAGAGAATAAGTETAGLAPIDLASISSQLIPETGAAAAGTAAGTIAPEVVVTAPAAGGIDTSALAQALSGIAAVGGTALTGTTAPPPEVTVSGKPITTAPTDGGVLALPGTALTGTTGTPPEVTVTEPGATPQTPPTGISPVLPPLVLPPLDPSMFPTSAPPLNTGTSTPSSLLNTLKSLIPGSGGGTKTGAGTGGAGGAGTGGQGVTGANFPAIPTPDVLMPNYYVEQAYQAPQTLPLGQYSAPSGLGTFQQNQPAPALQAGLTAQPSADTLSPDQLAALSQALQG